MNDSTVINLEKKLMTFSDVWSPKIIAQVNDSYIKLAKLYGEYVWHTHDNEDELFYVIKGKLKIELPDTTLVLHEGELVVIPRGVKHKPVADAEVHVMLIEPKTTLSTGDAQNTQGKKSTTGQWI